MKKVLLQLSVFFAVIVGLLTALIVTSLIVFAQIPAAESAVGGIKATWVFICITALILCFAIAVFAVRLVYKKILWYEELLDSIPFPISVTDMNMNWTFVNRPVEQMLNVKRESMLGKHCSNWGANICGTENCGIACLRKSKNQTFFEQGGGCFQVDSAFITDKKNNRIGHIELVRDITQAAMLQKQQAEILQNLDTGANSFSAAAKNIADGSQMLASSSMQQNTTVDDLLRSMASLSEKTNKNAAMAEKAMALANAIKDNAEKGSIQMDSMTQAVKDINEASHSISNVMKAIDNIAFQTNILALNAAVEAARAGQHGKGFAVVAEEVRNLAAKSAEAARDTGSLIANSIERASLGEKIAGETASSFADIMSGINESTMMTKEIAKASDEQNSAIKDINDSIGHFSDIVQQNGATSEELAATSKEMSSQTSQLHEMVFALSNKAGEKMIASEQEGLPEASGEYQ